MEAPDNVPKALKNSRFSLQAQSNKPKKKFEWTDATQKEIYENLNQLKHHEGPLIDNHNPEWEKSLGQNLINAL
jgi:hypothetical protein